ncbi:hypothetical protein CALCODRAFT_488673 [Calocera cornea HHB12733]|uniref:Protein kinase domain-containing protein n=1 Tax=Calocera cornea HHB12733 TaxID=1353952 RepID=A0A165CA93_9BASI|nr:hypothetical protein CALCODRAFT_488673 [Calocera cornea HHB12733]
METPLKEVKPVEEEPYTEEMRQKAIKRANKQWRRNWKRMLAGLREDALRFDRLLPAIQQDEPPPSPTTFQMADLGAEIPLLDAKKAKEGEKTSSAGPASATPLEIVAEHTDDQELEARPTSTVPKDNSVVVPARSQSHGHPYPARGFPGYRRRSIPYLRDEDPGFLPNPLALPAYIGPENILEGYESKSELIYDSDVKRLYRIDKKFLLTLFLPSVDVARIARNQDLASQVIPAPKVLRWGEMGDVSWMLTVWAWGRPLSSYIRQNPKLDYSHLSPVIAEVVSRLATVNLAHNDLYPNNVIVDNDLNLVAIIDWDRATTLEKSNEYQHRALMESVEHDWDFAFRPYHHPCFHWDPDQC